MKVSDFEYRIEYRIISDCEQIDDTCSYINEIFGHIYLEDGYGKRIEEVGRIKMNRVLLEGAINDGFPLACLFEHSHSIAKITDLIFDLDTGEWVE